MPPFPSYDCFFDFLTQFFPDLYVEPPEIQLPGLGERLSPFIKIERLADGQILPPQAAAAEWAARIGWPNNPSDKSSDATPHYRLLVAPVDDFAPFQRLLTAPELFTRKLALFLCLVLSNHPTNASSILAFLAHEFVLDSGSYDPTPEQRAPPEDDKDPFVWFRALFVRPPAARLSLGPTPDFEWDLPVKPDAPSFCTEILKLIRHIARRFLESDQPAEVAVFRQAMDLLEEVMLSGDTPPLRCVAGLLLNQMIYSKRKWHNPDYPPTGLLAPSSLSSQAILTKWGEVEAHLRR